MLAVIKHPNTFPIILIVLMYCACASQIYNKNYKMALYWFFGAGLNIAVIV